MKVIRPLVLAVAFVAVIGCINDSPLEVEILDARPTGRDLNDPEFFEMQMIVRLTNTSDSEIEFLGWKPDGLFALVDKRVGLFWRYYYRPSCATGTNGVSIPGNASTVVSTLIYPKSHPPIKGTYRVGMFWDYLAATNKYGPDRGPVWSSGFFVPSDVTPGFKESEYNNPTNNVPNTIVPADPDPRERGSGPLNSDR